tara:strand:- start:4804 stop:5067 length:264 start_codon:yes stop_codon:yes gene_type:complete
VSNCRLLVSGDIDLVSISLAVNSTGSLTQVIKLQQQLIVLHRDFKTNFKNPAIQPKTDATIASIKPSLIGNSSSIIILYITKKYNIS